MNSKKEEIPKEQIIIPAQKGSKVMVIVPVLVLFALQFAIALISMIFLFGRLLANIMGSDPDILSDPEALTLSLIHYLSGNLMGVLSICNLVVSIVCLIWYIKRKNKTPDAPIKSVLTFHNLAMCICLAFGFQFFAGTVLLFLKNIFPKATEDYAALLGISGAAQTNILSVLATVFLAALSEELVFRGLTLHYLKRCGATMLVANIIQALLFGVFHMNLLQGVYAFFMGLIFGYIAIKYQSLFLSFLTHLLLNLSGTLTDIMPNFFATTPGLIIELVLGIALLILGGFLMIQRKTKEGEPSV